MDRIKSFIILTLCLLATIRLAYGTFGQDEFITDDLELKYGIKKRIVTYNADLSPTICSPSDVDETHPMQCYYEKRRDKQIEIINRDQYQVEVMCLQGVWYEPDAAVIIQETKEHYPYSFSFLHNSDAEFNPNKTYDAPCRPEDNFIIQFLSICEHNMCYISETVEEIFACIEERCGVDLMRHVSGSCISCMFLGTVNNPSVECFTTDYAFNPTGLLILSKSKIMQPKRDFYSENIHELIRRGYLDVNVDGIGRFLCTQLTENLGKKYVEITDKFTSYKMKNKNELEKLLNLVKDEEKVIIAGDLSISPPLTRGADIVSQFVDNYDLIRYANFQDPVSDHVEFVPAFCSVCFGNDMTPKRYLEEHGDADGFIFDHILVRGFNVSRLSIHKFNPDIFRVFQETIEGNHPLSSHYGQLVTIRMEEIEENVPNDDDQDLL